MADLSKEGVFTVPVCVFYTRMPPKKGKGRGKRSCSDKPQVSDTQRISSDETDTVAVDSEEVEQHEADLTVVEVHQQETQETQPKAGPSGQTVAKPKPLGRKKKGSEERHFLFTEEMEEELVEFWREHPFLYNSADPRHKDKGLKDRLLRAKAEVFGCTSKYWKKNSSRI